MKQAELAARSELQTIVAGFAAGHWQEAVGSSGTARALAEILQANGWTDGGITPDGLDRLRCALIKAGDVTRLDLPGLKPRPPAGAAGRARDHARGVRRAQDRAHDPWRPARCARAYSTTCWGASSTTTCATSRWRSSCSAITSTSSRRAGSRPWRSALLRQFSGDLQARPSTRCTCCPGRPACTRSAFPSPTPATTSIRPTSSRTPTCRAFPRWNRRTCRCWCWRIAARMEKMKGQITNSLDLAMVMAMRLAVLFHRSRSDVRMPPLEAHCSGRAFRLELDASVARRKCADGRGAERGNARVREARA